MVINTLIFRELVLVFLGFFIQEEICTFILLISWNFRLRDPELRLCTHLSPAPPLLPSSQHTWTWQRICIRVLIHYKKVESGKFSITSTKLFHRLPRKKPNLLT